MSRFRVPGRQHRCGSISQGVHSPRLCFRPAQPFFKCLPLPRLVWWHSPEASYLFDIVQEEAVLV